MADIIISYCEPIDTALVTSKQHFISHLSKQGHRILYLESPPTLLSFIKHFRFYKKRGLTNFFSLIQKKQNVWSVCGFHPFPYHKGFFGIFDKLFLNKLNQFFMLFFIKKIAKKLGFKNPQFIIYYPNILPILKHLNPNRTLFHIVDNWSGMPGYPKTLEQLVVAALKQSDKTIVSSTVCFESYKKYAPDRVHLLHHGVYLDMFSPVYQRKSTTPHQRLPNENITIGYYGALHKLDFTIIKSVAEQRPNWQFIFHGPINGLQGIPLKLIEILPNNVVVKDKIPYQELPNFLLSIDLFWMPFIANPATHAMCPIKIFEVAAAGIPAVISRLEEPEKIAKLFFYDSAQSMQEHISAIENALINETLLRKEKRNHVIAQHDWKNIAVKFEDYLLGL